MKLIELELRGGLGNQLFQVSGAIYYAKRSGAKVVVDDSALRSHRNPTRRNWVKSINLNQLFNTNVEIEFKENHLPKFFNQIRLMRFLQLSEEQLFHSVDLARLTRIEGYFQNSRYVSVHEINGSAIESRFSDFCLCREAIAIHVRLGDFLSHGWDLPKSYYLSALSLMLEHKNVEVHVYSDSPELAREMINSEFPRLEIQFPELVQELNPLELLLNLSRYRYFISSNSSLAWWASLINIDNKEFIILPEIWRNNLGFSTQTNLAYV